jgi:uncharacterized paraquat-inducible protein A
MVTCVRFVHELCNELNAGEAASCDQVEVKQMAVPNLWRTKKQRYSLHGEVCVHCARAVFPPREICPHCHKPMQHAAATEPIAFAFPALATSVPALPVAVVGDD